MTNCELLLSDELSESAAKKLIKHWGVNDWRDSASYPDGRSENNDMWRWEFLRRDALYREIWHAWWTGQGQTASADELINFGLHEFLDPRVAYKSHIKKRRDIFQQYPAIVEGDEVTWTYTDTDESTERDIQSTLNLDTDGLIDIRINLKRPIAPQLDSAAIRRALGTRQKNLVGRVLRHRISDDAALYLRAIDAKFVKASNTTIGLYIFGCATKPSAATRGRQVEIKTQKMWQEF